MLIAIGRALSQQRDTMALLEIILRRAREVTGADAGSVYIVEGDRRRDRRAPHGSASRSRRTTRARSSRRASPCRCRRRRSSGSCVLSSDVINIPDLYALDDAGSGNNPWGFVHDRSFDDKHRYQTRSMLTVPMISARSEVIGVIQLINKRAKGAPAVLEGPDDVRSLRGAVRRGLDGVRGRRWRRRPASRSRTRCSTTRSRRCSRASCARRSTAIESRDPTTSGHSRAGRRAAPSGWPSAVDRDRHAALPRAHASRSTS